MQLLTMDRLDLGRIRLGGMCTHIQVGIHISNGLSASLNSAHCPHICARCTPVITGQRVGGATDSDSDG